MLESLALLPNESIWGLVDVNIDNDWGQKNPDFRAKIRTHLQNQYGGKCLNLEQLPKPKRGYISISHTKDLGGCAWAPFPIGIDIESKDRPVLKRLGERISLNNEAQAWDNPLHLWAAKEAAFKALKNAQYPIKVISQITVTKKSELNEIIEFNFSCDAIDAESLNFCGRVFILERSILALAAIFT
jgi:phosphopantetheinyl transferase (holo-ACP synthase)